MYFKAFNFLFFLTLFIYYCDGLNKYSKEANIQSEPKVEALRTLEKPFRMAKLNMLWAKAQQRLTLPKLKSLFGELKIHDKEEITWKKLKAEGKDKEGLQEANLRKKIIGIMSSYDLLEHFEDIHNKEKQKPHKALNEAHKERLDKMLFKDKKLNKLWEKAQFSGFTSEELMALKEEFQHHQDKIDEYYSLLEDIDRGKQDDHENSIDEKLVKFNMLTEEEAPPEKDYLDKANLLRTKHRDIRDEYDRLHRLTAKGPRSKEFVEPKVDGLWKMAVNSSFTPDELESIRIELKHYETRIQKLRTMQVEAALAAERLENKQKIAGQKLDHVDMMEANIKKQANKINQLHENLAEKIKMKHLEL